MDYSYDSRIINLMYCKLCGILNLSNLSTCMNKFSLCSNCYRISSGWEELTLTKKTILILYFTMVRGIPLINILFAKHFNVYLLFVNFVSLYPCTMVAYRANESSNIIVPSPSGS